MSKPTEKEFRNSAFIGGELGVRGLVQLVRST
jgi:hypothetical protein